MRQGMTRREMLLGNLAALVGGMVAVLFGPWLRRGRAVPTCAPPAAPLTGPRCYSYPSGPVYQVTTYTYDASGELIHVQHRGPASAITHTYAYDGGRRDPAGL